MYSGDPFFQPPTMHTPTLLTVLGTSAVATAQLHDLAVAAGLEYFGIAYGEAVSGDDAYVTLTSNMSEIGQLTPENGQKWAYTEPTRGEFAYAGAEVVPGIAAANGQILRCHALTWHSQLPNWGELPFFYLSLTYK